MRKICPRVWNGALRDSLPYTISRGCLFHFICSCSRANCAFVCDWLRPGIYLRLCLYLCACACPPPLPPNPGEELFKPFVPPPFATFFALFTLHLTRPPFLSSLPRPRSFLSHRLSLRSLPSVRRRLLISVIPSISFNVCLTWFLSLSRGSSPESKPLCLLMSHSFFVPLFYHSSRRDSPNVIPSHAIVFAATWSNDEPPKQSQYLTIYQHTTD